MAYTPAATSVRLCMIAAGMLVVAGLLSIPFTFGLATLTVAFAGAYEGARLAAVLASIVALPLASLVCIGASVIVLARLLASKPWPITIMLLMTAAAVVPLAFLFWKIVAWWVAQ